MNRVFLGIWGWFPAITWMGLLSYVSHLPGSSVTVPAFPFADKVCHFGAYCILGLLLQNRGKFCLAFRVCPPIPGLGVSLLIGILHGILDEIHQRFIPLRDFSYFDMMANVSGVLAGVYLTWLWFGKRSHR